MAPTPDNNHPTRLNVPYDAKVAGSIKIPDATIFPITSDVPVQIPILLLLVDI
jgi:hypothetical protein